MLKRTMLVGVALLTMVGWFAACDDDEGLAQPITPGTSGGDIVVLVGDSVADSLCVNASPPYCWDGGALASVSVEQIEPVQLTVWEWVTTDGTDLIESCIEHGDTLLPEGVEQTVASDDLQLKLEKYRDTQARYRVTVARSNGDSGYVEFISTGGCGTGGGTGDVDTFAVVVGDTAGCVNRSPAYAWPDTISIASLSVRPAADTATVVWEIHTDDGRNQILSPVVHGTVPETAVLGGVLADRLERLDRDSTYLVVIVKRNGETASSEFTVTGGCN